MKSTALLRMEPTADVALVEVTGLASLIHVHGSSTSVSTVDRDRVSSFSVVRPSDRERSIVSLYVGRGQNDSMMGIIEIDWSKDNPVMVENLWVPPADRLGQAFSDYMDVLTPRTTYTTQKPGTRGERKNVSWVPDGNLLCRFLVGLATEEDVEAAIQRRVEEQSLAEEVVQLRADNLRLANANGELERASNELAWERNCWRLYNDKLKGLVRSTPWYQLRKTVQAHMARSLSDFAL